MDIEHFFSYLLVLLCIGAVPIAISSTSNCVPEWFGTVSVQGNSLSSHDSRWYYPVHHSGCTGRYIFSYITFPPDQSIVISIADGRYHASVADLPPGTTGSTTLYLDFGLHPDAQDAPWILAMRAWPEDYTMSSDTLLYFTFRLEGVPELDPWWYPQSPTPSQFATPTATSSTSNCVPKWFGTVPVNGGPLSPLGARYYYTIHPSGCTGRYVFSYMTFPPDQSSVVSIVKQYETLAELSPGTTGSTTLYLDFGVPPDDPGAAWNLAMHAWPEDDARWNSDASLYYMFRLEGVPELDPGPYPAFSYPPSPTLSWFGTPTATSRSVFGTPTTIPLPTTTATATATAAPTSTSRSVFGIPTTIPLPTATATATATAAPPTLNCISEWFGSIPVEGGLGYLGGMYRLIPNGDVGCTGQYIFNYAAFPNNRPVIVTIMDVMSRPIDELPPSTTGSITLELDFGMDRFNYGAPWGLSIRAVHRGYLPGDPIILAGDAGTQVYYTIRLKVVEPQSENRQSPVSQFFNRDIGSVKMSTFIGATAGSVVLATAMIGGFVWRRRKVKRRSARRVTVTAEQGQLEREGEAGANQAHMDVSAGIPASSRTRRRSRRSPPPEAGAEGADAGAGAHADIDSRFAALIGSVASPGSTRRDVDFDDGTVDIETMRVLIEASKQRQAALSKQLREEQAAMYELMLGYLTERQQEPRGMASRSPPVNDETSRNVPVVPEQPIERSLPDPDAIVIEALKKDRRNVPIVPEHLIERSLPDPDAIEVLENDQRDVPLAPHQPTERSLPDPDAIVIEALKKDRRNVPIVPEHLIERSLPDPDAIEVLENDQRDVPLAPHQPTERSLPDPDAIVIEALKKDRRNVPIVPEHLIERSMPDPDAIEVLDEDRRANFESLRRG